MNERERTRNGNEKIRSAAANSMQNRSQGNGCEIKYIRERERKRNSEASDTA